MHETDTDRRSWTSGLTAAINLAMAGCRSPRLRKRSDVGKRFHGDVQGWRTGLNVIEDIGQMNIAVNFDCAPVNELTITNGSAGPRFTLSRRPTTVLRRQTALYRQFVTRLEGIVALAAGVHLHFKSQRLRGILADNRLPAPSHAKFAVDKGIVFHTDHEDAYIFLVNDDAATKGTYLLITDGCGCM